jgi:hypothetical protein
MTVAAAPRAEHISLESEPDLALAHTPAPRRKVRATYSLRSTLRGCSTEISLLEDHFASVQSERPSSEPMDYVLDLRFANAKPLCVRRIAWTWLSLSLVFGLLATAAGWLSYSTNAPLAPTLLVGAAMLAGAVTSTFIFLRRTTESLEFTSVHGQATLISITGGIGSARAGKTFFINLIKSISAAKQARPQSKQEFLRDEMREHHRLRELGVLTQLEYETSKARILAAHK